ncbi:hypothetical protein BH11BAC1_BH11BAC1_09550 [soil metagenome]
MNKIAFILFVFYAFVAQGQKEAYHWYFGDHAGLDFTSGSPVAVTNGAMYTDEGCSSISDANGLLLFSTNGINVYNKNHTLMPNGFGLNGHTSSSQSAMIVKKPGSVNDFYIFTTDALGGISGLSYSIVDMSLQAGLGDVSVKNIQLVTPVCEHLTGTFHANGNDVWVMAHLANSSDFYAYLVTAAGISAPVITSIGVNQNSNSLQASMKFSPAGDRLACPLQILTHFEVYDFDNATGILSNVMQLNNVVWSNPFSVEFSPSGRFLYGAYDPGGGVLLQFDLSLGSAAAITAGAVNVGAYTGSYFGSLQLGPDQKIYAGELNNNYIGVVNDPESLGVACNFVDTGVFLAGKISEYGLPNFMTGYFSTPIIPVALFSAPHHVCPGTCTDFTNNSSYGTSYLWSFPGANPVTSTDVNPTTICYNTPGNYDVQLIASNVNGSDTLVLPNYITVYPFPSPQGISQSGDTLFAFSGAVSYQWYLNGIDVAGATDYFYVATESGNYNVVATDANGCEVEAAIFDVVAGIQGAVDFSQLSIFPNPVSDKIYFQNRGFSNGHAIDISIYNMIGGKILSAVDYGLKTIGCELLPPGIYWLEIKTEENITWIKFMKSSGY